jgi:virginiamycin A acetyltransferase
VRAREQIEPPPAACRHAAGDSHDASERSAFLDLDGPDLRRMRHLLRVKHHQAAAGGIEHRLTACLDRVERKPTTDPHLKPRGAGVDDNGTSGLAESDDLIRLLNSSGLLRSLGLIAVVPDLQRELLNLSAVEVRPGVHEGPAHAAVRPPIERADLRDARPAGPFGAIFHGTSRQRNPERDRFGPSHPLVCSVPHSVGQHANTHRSIVSDPVFAPMREAVKAALRGVSFVIVLPSIASFYVRSLFLGRDQALEGSTQTLALVPGLVGQYLRRAFLSVALERCASSSVVSFGTIFSKAGARLDENVYVGAGCFLGLVHLGQDVLVGSGVHITSGRHTHGTGESSRPIRDQEGQTTIVRVGAGSWIGSAAVVMADVGKNSIVGAGAVVTSPIADNVVAAGVPAKVIKSR